MTDAPDARLDAVRSYGILDAPRDGAFEAIARVAAAALGTPISTVSIVDADRVWFAAAHGLDGVDQVGTEPGLCASAVMADDVYVVNDAAVDPRTLDHPLVRGELGLRFYAAAPVITADGHHLGTVTAIDTVAREVSDREQAVLRGLADVVAQQLEVRLQARAVVRSEQTLRDDAERRAEVARSVTQRLRQAAAAQATADRPTTCELGGLSQPCTAQPDLKVADPWGDSAWGCSQHVEEVLLHVRSAFVADEDLGGLGAYRLRR
ncbi:MAG: hypothetical protein JWP95_719 [Actinotalea sp.]|nr:hypothetical protein [Actinotalea sp.]